MSNRNGLLRDDRRSCRGSEVALDAAAARCRRAGSMAADSARRSGASRSASASSCPRPGAPDDRDHLVRQRTSKRDVPRARASPRPYAVRDVVEARCSRETLSGSRRRPPASSSDRPSSSSTSNTTLGCEAMRLHQLRPSACDSCLARACTIVDRARPRTRRGRPSSESPVAVRGRAPRRSAMTPMHHAAVEAARRSRCEMHPVLTDDLHAALEERVASRFANALVLDGPRRLNALMTLMPDRIAMRRCSHLARSAPAFGSSTAADACGEKIARTPTIAVGSKAERDERQLPRDVEAEGGSDAAATMTVRLSTKSR